MTSPTTIAEAWDQRASEAALASPAPTPQAQSRRDFYAGALAALRILGNGTSSSVLFSELAQYGRTIGSAAERAA
jgi:predicted Zn-dependent peptidase